MKQFLRKKPVMISLVAVAIFMLVVYVVMLARPISYGFNYVYTQTKDISEQTIKLNFKSSSVLRQKLILEQEDEKDVKITTDLWIYRDGDTAYIIGVKKYIKSTELTKLEIEELNDSDDIMTKNEYKVAIEEIKKAKKQSHAQYEMVLNIKSDGMKIEDIGIYKIENGDMVAKNIQAVLFTIIHGILTVAVITFATISVVLFIKQRKNI